MANGKGQFGLTIAERRKPTDTSFNTRGNAVEKWVADLPLGNVGAVAKMLYEALREVNHLAIGWRERQRFLEQLRHPVAYVQGQLERHYSGTSFPLTPKVRQVVDLAKALSDQMALGYKNAIEEMQGSSFLSRDNTALTELIHRAIYYLSASLLTCYKTYAPQPEGKWFELHLLYLHAEHKKIHTNPVSDSENKALPKSSIARLYKQILLLALASPYRLQQGEAQAVYQTLARWAAHAHIIPYHDPNASEALFVVHMDSDKAPDFKAFEHRDCNTELCRLVDTRQLSHVLQEELSYLGAQGGGNDLSADLLQRLVRCWGIAPKRSFSRSDKEDSLEVVFGLSSLHRALASEMGDESQLPERSRYKSKSVVSASQPTARDVWNIFSSDSLGKQYEYYKRQSDETDKRPKPKPEVERQQWQIRNESAGGYRLAIEQVEATKVQVGELLGLRRRDGGLCEVGVVRWMRQPADGGFEMGVQVLAPQVVPVMLRNARLGGKAAEFQPALMLPEVPTIGLAATLLTPIMLFSSGMELQLHHPERDIRIVLTGRGEETGSFSQFSFKTKSEGRKPAPVEEKLGDILEQEELSIIWEDL